MYKIKELETNVVYDDTYVSFSEAEKVVEYYRKDDGKDRSVTYAIIEAED